MNYVDHVAGAQANLLQQYQGRPLINTLLTVAGQELNQAEQACIDLFNLRSIDVAAGLQLDGWGAILNLARAGMTDSAFRAALYAIAAAYTTTGTPEQLMALARLLFGAGCTVTIVEDQPAVVIVQIENGAPILSETQIHQIFQTSKPAGVALAVVVVPSDPYFGFNEDSSPNAAGFDAGNWGDIY